ncbi:MAG: HNH endonuclease [Rikenellaceae bacterium]|nr:HNH endonuclease [Rikenellaceae bacterium]
MKTFLFAYNPENWYWDNIETAISNIRDTGVHLEKWSIRSYKQVSVGDRAFLMRLGRNTANKGIIGAGYIGTDPFLSEHWNGSGELVHSVIIEFDTLSEKPFITLDELRTLPSHNWTPQSSGQAIPDNVASGLEELWFKKTLGNADKIFGDNSLREGAVKTAISRKYERNPRARRLCIEANGCSCKICCFDFKETYGELGENYIHVHHIVPLSDVGEEHRIVPERDLIPICPNCHAMIHRKSPSLGINELKELLSRRS